jgi:hypothetical protein
MADEHAAKPILAYATPRGVDPSAEPPGEFFMSFAPPPVKWQLLLQLVAFLVCLVGTLIFLGALVGVLIDRHRSEPDKPLIAGMGACFCGAMAFAFIVAMRRLKRFGHLPVTIAVSNGVVTIVEPMRNHGAPRSISADQVTRCTYHRMDLSVLAPHPYIIRIEVMPLRSYQVRVAMGDAGVLARAVNDLERAIKHGRWKLRNSCASSS